MQMASLPSSLISCIPDIQQNPPVQLNNCTQFDPFETSHHAVLVSHAPQGAVMKSGPLEPYVVFDRQNEGKSESYVPLATFDDDPDAGDITPLFGRSDQW